MKVIIKRIWDRVESLVLFFVCFILLYLSNKHPQWLPIEIAIVLVVFAIFVVYDFIKNKE